MIGKEILEIEGKTILKITAFDHIGYDRGFICEFDDGSWLEMRPIPIQGPDARIEFEFKEGPNDDMRRDICKCGSIIKWDVDDSMSVISCPSCKTLYNVDSDSQMIYWLEERFDDRKPWKTPSR